jgi:hypothetical protein
MAKNSLNTYLFFFLGSLINVFSYFSIAPFLIALIFYFLTQLLFNLNLIGGLYEKRIFSRLFSIYFMMSGVAAISANQFGDYNQLFSDPQSFFEIATSLTSDISVIEIQLIHEGALGIILWRGVYDFFEKIGFEKLRYIGIIFNVIHSL